MEKEELFIKYTKKIEDPTNIFDTWNFEIPLRKNIFSVNPYSVGGGTLKTLGTTITSTSSSVLSKEGLIDSNGEETFAISLIDIGTNETIKKQNIKLK